MRKGFTLIELMIVIAIIAIIAAIAIPNLLESRITANESAAANSLSGGVFPGQVTFASGSYNDLDGDNKGEYGYLGQLSGEVDAWTATGVELSLIGVDFDDSGVGGADGTTYTARTTTDIDEAKGGYWFGSVLDVQSDFDASANAANIRNGENYFCHYAYPEVFDDTGRRSFVMTQEKQVMTEAAQEYANAEAVVSQCMIDAANGGLDEAVSKSNRNPEWNPM